MSRRALIAIAAAGLVVRLVLLPLPGTIDVEAYKLWSFGAVQDFSGVYGVGGTPVERGIVHWNGLSGAVTYPPMALVELAMVGRVYQWLRPDFPDSRLLTVFVKVPGLLSEVALAALFLTWGRRLAGDRAAAWAAAAFWLSPGIWLTGEGLGYFDAPAALPIVAALLAAGTGRGWLGGVLSALAVLIKPQAIFLVPVSAALLVRRSGGRDWRALVDMAAGAAIVTVLVFLPFLARGSCLNVMNALSRLLQHDMLSAQAANLGWIATWLLRVVPGIPDVGWHRALTMPIRILAITRIVELGYPNMRLIGTALTSAAIVWATWRTWRAPSLANAAALAAWSAYAYMMLGAQVHENHLYMVLPILAFAAGAVPALRSAFWWISAILVVNIHLFEGFGRGLGAILDRRWTFIDMTVVLSVVNLCVFVWFTRRVARATRPAATRVAGE